MIEIGSFADEPFAIEQEKQGRRNFHFLSARLDPGPLAALRSPKTTLHDNCIVRVMDRGSLYVEVREGRQKGFQESIYRFCTIGDSTERRHFIARMLESLDGGCDVVPNSFSLDVLIYDRLSVRSPRVHNIIRHCIPPH
jgi:hypothetical protein